MHGVFLCCMPCSSAALHKLNANYTAPPDKAQSQGLLRSLHQIKAVVMGKWRVGCCRCRVSYGYIGSANCPYYSQRSILMLSKNLHVEQDSQIMQSMGINAELWLDFSPGAVSYGSGVN